jgi:hypothetical protein
MGLTADEYELANVYPLHTDKNKLPTKRQVQPYIDELKEHCEGKKIVCLGSFVGNLFPGEFVLPHPSPLNRKLNGIQDRIPSKELDLLKSELNN